MNKFNYTSNSDISYIDDLYTKYKLDPQSVDITWQKFFEGFEFAEDNSLESIKFTESSVSRLIQSYRKYGHLNSLTNPVRTRRDHNVRFNIEEFGLSKDDLSQTFSSGAEIGLKDKPLRDIIEKLNKIYVGSIGFEYFNIRNTDEVNWIKKWVEEKWFSQKLKKSKKETILKKLNEAVVFENFLHTKYIGQKRFSLEGGENTITFLNEFIKSACESDVKEVVIGMAHRGRLNVLTSILQKTYDEIFNEFEGNMDPDLIFGDGDVKYHLGYNSFISEGEKNIYVKLIPNPSHLESVNPVVMGYTRAQIDEEYKGNFDSAIPILIHGDAAIAGQGIVYETIQMSQLDGYKVGGVIHFVINNQIGFTTDYDDARSSIYCTDLAKIIDSPVLHVNGDDPEAVFFASKFALAYRQKFKKDMFIDLLCYRRHGHNESDEPKFTQPNLYNLISKHPSPRDVYFKRITENNNEIDKDLASKLNKDFRQKLQERLDEVKQKPLPYKPQKKDEEWSFLRSSEPKDFKASPETRINLETLEKIGKALVKVPDGFKPLKQITRLLNDREKNFFKDKSLNWADAELLAYGSLLNEKKFVRISGQDVVRGTFSHRHAQLFDANSNSPYSSLDFISDDQVKLKIYNSLLSEFGVLGFEYGYSMASPNTLVVWEAQFGDFSNGAQVIIDQFISSAETKWEKMNCLLVLLPHGYEGQGPEHSSARPQRLLSLCSEDNMVVVNLTTPANLFHLIRRQLAWDFRKPCFVLSPKSLLRHPKVFSKLSDFTDSSFKEVIDDCDNKNKIKKIVLCTGKFFYDLEEFKHKNKVEDVSIIRIEQLSPFPLDKVLKILKSYKNHDKLIWAQEENQNMGYWSYISSFNIKGLELISRKRSSSPSTGFLKVHIKEQEELIKKIFK